MTSAVAETASPAPTRRPRRPPPSPFVIGGLIGAVALTIVTGADWRFGIGFSLTGIWDEISRQIPFVNDMDEVAGPISGMFPPDMSILLNSRVLDAFVETVQMAVIGTICGSLVALPLALFNSRLGAPNRIAYGAVKLFNNVIRSFPELLWALLFVTAVGIGALPGILALFFFSIAVVTKLTSDTIDGIDPGPIEAARASGAGHAQVLRTAVVPQVLPGYTSFAMYCFELNLRASAVLGLVGAGGIGELLNFFRNQGAWPQVWGVVAGFVIVVMIVEQISMALRRRLL